MNSSTTAFIAMPRPTLIRADCRTRLFIYLDWWRLVNITKHTLSHQRFTKFIRLMVGQSKYVYLYRARWVAGNLNPELMKSDLLLREKERYKLGGQLQWSVDPRWRYVQQLPDAGGGTTERGTSSYAKNSRRKQRQKYVIFYFYHLLLRISAVIGRYGPHLMIVMIFVTQNNLKRSRNFRPSPWIWPRKQKYQEKCVFNWH